MKLSTAPRAKELPSFDQYINESRLPNVRLSELIVEYPKTVEKYRRRRFLRSPVAIKGKLMSKSSSTISHEIKTINISAGGAYFELLSPFAYDGPTEMGESIELELCLPEQEPMLLPAHVVRAESQTSLDQVITERLAVEFEEVASKERTKIGLFISLVRYLLF